MSGYTLVIVSQIVLCVLQRPCDDCDYYEHDLYCKHCCTDTSTNTTSMIYYSYDYNVVCISTACAFYQAQQRVNSIFQ